MIRFLHEVIVQNNSDHKIGRFGRSELGAGLKGWYSRFETRLQPTKIKTQKVSIMNQVGLSTAVRDRVLFKDT